MDLKAFTTIESCEDALLSELSDVINQGLTQKTTYSLALAGGGTPKGLYEKLSRTELNWSNINITLTDERWVDPRHADSNENMLRQTLFKNQGKMARFIGLKNPEKTAQAGQIRTDHLLKQNASKLDCVVLGMGEDGHFASIFPSMPNTDALLDLTQPAYCLPANPADKPARMSLTLRYLLTAQHIYVFIKGNAKRQLIEQQSLADITQPLPIYYLLNQTLCPVTIYWSES
jgi:6-phosphogluconolactonase